MQMEFFHFEVPNMLYSIFTLIYAERKPIVML